MIIASKHFPRIITGAVLVSVLGTALYLSGPYLFGLLLLFTLVGLWEFYAMFWPLKANIGGRILGLALGGLLITAAWMRPEMVVMTRPASWDHSNIVLSGWGLRRRVIVFAHVAHLLRKDEIVALAAHEAAHVRHFHGVLRLLINVAVSYIFCWLAGWGATHVQFFEGFNYSPMLTLDMPGTHAGSVCAVALVVFPMLLYPLSPLLNLAARLMQYDADLHAARIAGLDPMISALVKLHKDTTTSLSPSLVYSLFHYKRPHPGMRVANLLRLKRLSAPGGRLEHLFPKPAEPRAPEAD